MASQPATRSDYGAAPLGLNVTRDLAAFLARFRFEDVPEAEIHEACRGVLDWIGCALAGSGHGEVTTLIDVLREAGGRPQASVLGR